VYEYRCKVTRVVDGDTVDVDIDLGFGVWMHKQRIRLHGIDTPESRTRDLDEKKYGLIAKEHIKSFMPVGSMQTLVTVKDKAGKYGRILGKFLIYDKKTDAQMTINDWMIREHHAVAYFGQSKEDIAEEHLVNRKLLGEDHIMGHPV
jgi:micrococcal nuclease